jgi:hypothetical protein
MNNRDYILQEFEAIEKCPDKYQYLIPLKEDILSMSEKIAGFGFSGSAAPIVTQAICHSIEDLLLFKNVEPLLGTDDEWTLVDEKNTLYQNKRDSSVFKGEDGRCHDNGAFAIKEKYRNGEYQDDPLCWSSAVTVPSTGKYLFKAHIKSFPYTQRRFALYAACFEFEKDTAVLQPGSGWWRSYAINEAQIAELGRYYDLEYVDLHELDKECLKVAMKELKKMGLPNGLK